MSDEPSARSKPRRGRWQFSVRGLLFATALVAGVLAVAVQLPTLFQVALIVTSIGCFFAAVMWTANFATSDRRPLLAVVSWTLFGAFFSLYAVAVALLAREYNDASVAPTWGFVLGGIAAVMAVCALVCFFRARRSVVRWRRARRTVEDDGGAER